MCLVAWSGYIGNNEWSLGTPIKPLGTIAYEAIGDT